MTDIPLVSFPRDIVENIDPFDCKFIVTTTLRGAVSVSAYDRRGGGPYGELHRVPDLDQAILWYETKATDESLEPMYKTICHENIASLTEIRARLTEGDLRRASFQAEEPKVPMDLKESYTLGVRLYGNSPMDEIDACVRIIKVATSRIGELNDLHRTRDERLQAVEDALADT